MTYNSVLQMEEDLQQVDVMTQMTSPCFRAHWKPFVLETDTKTLLILKQIFE